MISPAFNGRRRGDRDSWKRSRSSESFARFSSRFPDAVETSVSPFSRLLNRRCKSTGPRNRFNRSLFDPRSPRRAKNRGFFDAKNRGKTSTIAVTRSCIADGTAINYSSPSKTVVIYFSPNSDPWTLCDSRQRVEDLPNFDLHLELSASSRRFIVSRISSEYSSQRWETPGSLLVRSRG